MADGGAGAEAEGGDGGGRRRSACFFLVCAHLLFSFGRTRPLSNAAARQHEPVQSHRTHICSPAAAQRRPKYRSQECKTAAVCDRRLVRRRRWGAVAAEARRAEASTARRHAGSLLCLPRWVCSPSSARPSVRSGRSASSLCEQMRGAGQQGVGCQEPVAAFECLLCPAADWTMLARLQW
jgi:hypothetical protein